MIKSINSIILVSMFSLPVYAQDRITGRSFATRSEVIARNGMAATSQPLATQVALDILKQGGNAIDAAIAANAVLGLMEPTGNGMGGDLFAIVWDAKTGKLYGLNASGRSPQRGGVERRGGSASGRPLGRDRRSRYRAHQGCGGGGASRGRAILACVGRW